MWVRVFVILAMLVGASRVALADETLHRYEGEVLVYDESTGWQQGDPCEAPCSESVQDGHFVLTWAQQDDLATYFFRIATPKTPPPPSTLWVEWRFRSNHPLGPTNFTCDAHFAVEYGGTFDLVHLHGDAAIGDAGSISGLDLADFHTYRYESLDGINYRIAVDGQVFIETAEDNPTGNHTLQFRGWGACAGASPNGFPMVNEWDFVRFGTISSGEQIISSDPPAGFLDPDQYPALDRFTVTFDSDNYVYIDDITVEVTAGDTPIVLQTRRRENDEPDTVEIVLDRPLTLNETTTFTFDTGIPADCNADPPINCVKYTLALPPPIPTLPTWGLIAMALLLASGGAIVIAKYRRTA